MDYWNHVLWSDETKINLFGSDGVKRVWRQPGQLAAGTCEVVTLDRDSSQPRRTIARQTARCACRKGQIAGTTRARPACVDGKTLAVLCRLLPATTSPLK
ncbi:hypothetical protein PFLUV_G00094470 [Perca fluviatilis]|uniref:TAFA chemokine like family member 5 n=1 Tax=Perca fluviatilis TaxID=8168 RepID=A0A6A5FAQ7_PERFL|nr:hypothetical protein PFLUV_G00094470 [Perca fluviatilis]